VGLGEDGRAGFRGLAIADERTISGDAEGNHHYQKPGHRACFQPCASRLALAEDLIEALSEEVLRKPPEQNFR